MADTYLIAAVIVMLNEGMVDECACPECTEYKTTMAKGIITLVRDHDAVKMEDPLPQPGPAQGFQSVERHEPSMMDGGRSNHG